MRVVQVYFHTRPCSVISSYTLCLTDIFWINKNSEDPELEIHFLSKNSYDRDYDYVHPKEYDYITYEDINGQEITIYTNTISDWDVVINNVKTEITMKNIR